MAGAVRDRPVADGFRPSDYRGSDGIDTRVALGTLSWADVLRVIAESHNIPDVGDAAQLLSAAGRDRVAAALEAVRAYAASG